MIRGQGVYFGLGVALVLTACDRSYLEGRVTDIHGEALPGVIVRESSSAAEQDLTDGLGHYRIPLAQATARIVFSKSGYTSAELPLNQAAGRGTAMPEVALWRLPMNPGVYVVNDLRFAEATWVVPRQFYLKDGTASYGAELPKEVRDAAGEPFIVAYRTPRYNARLSRLTAAEAQRGTEAESIAVWVEEKPMAAALEPIDTPEGRLLRVRVGRPLEPGIYGVHWGALEGYTTLDARMFLFRIPEPPPAESEEVAVEASAEPKAAAPVSATGKPGGTSSDKPEIKQTPPAPAVVPRNASPVSPPELLEPADTPPATR
jgi:hypothetical protein